MAATGKTFPMFIDSLAQKKVDLDSDTLKVMLLSAYTYAATHQYLDQVKAAGTEASGIGYSAGGATIGSVTWTRTGDSWSLDGADTVWNGGSSTGTLAAKYAVIYDSTPGTDATNPVIGYINLDGAAGTLTATDAPFTIAWNAAGILVPSVP